MIRNFIALLLAVFALSAYAAVEVNRATRAELETVKGIGPGLSAKILEARKTSGFKDWQDMVERVGGVGPGNATRFSQAGLTVAGAAYDSKAAAPKAAKAPRAAKEPKAKKSGKADQPQA